MFSKVKKYVQQRKETSIDPKPNCPEKPSGFVSIARYKKLNCVSGWFLVACTMQAFHQRFITTYTNTNLLKNSQVCIGPHST